MNRNVILGLGIVGVFAAVIVALLLFDGEDASSTPPTAMALAKDETPTPSTRSPVPVTTPTPDPKATPTRPTTPPKQDRAEAAPAPRRIADRFLFPQDTGGMLAQQVLAPTAPPTTNIPSRGTPTTRQSPLDRGEIPLPELRVPVPVVENPPATMARLTPPPEVVPVTIGRGAELDLTAIRLPETGGPWQAAGPFPEKDMASALAKEFAPEKAAFDAAAKFMVNDRTITWQKLLPASDGFYNLLTLHGPAAGNSATYLVRTLESPRDQEVSFLLGTDDGAKFWLNGEKLWQSEASRVAEPGQNRVTAKLRKGANTLLLKVANGDGEHGFFFSVNGGTGLKLK